jgi:hypothetical protein
MNSVTLHRALGGYPPLFADAGMPDPVVVADTVTSADPALPSKPPFTTMAAAAAVTGAVSAEEALNWLDQLATAAQHHHFFWALTMFAVGHTRP